MAYRSFDPAQDLSLFDDGGPGASAAARQATFSALEWQVIAIARRDGRRSLATPGRLAVALGMIFGGERPNPRLADARLEALRRFAVLAWHDGEDVAQPEREAFEAAGFTSAHRSLLMASIARARNPQPMVNRGRPARRKHR